MNRSLLWLRSVRHRPAASAGLFAIVVVAVAAALTGPLIVRSAEQSALRSALDRSAPGEYDIVITAEVATDGVASSEQATTDTAGGAGAALYRAPVTYLLTSHPSSWTPVSASRKRNSTLLVSFPDDCSHIRLVSGQCALRGARVVVPVGTATVGEVIAFDSGDRFTVVGTYRPDHATAVLFGTGVAPLVMPTDPLLEVTSAALVTTRSSLIDSRVDLDRLPDALQDFQRVKRLATLQPVVTSPTTTLTELATDVADQRRVATVIGLLVVVPLVVLCWWALMLVMQLIAVVRGAEWALGRLRGLPVFTWLRSIYVEPLMLVVLGAAAGVVVGYGLSSVTVSLTMADGIGLEPWRLPVLFSVIATLLGALLGVGLATIRGIRVPLATLLQETAEPVRLSRTAVATQFLLVALTALALVQLTTQSQVQVGAGNLGLLLPGLLAALLTGAVVQIGSARIRRRSGRPPRRTAGLVLGRRLARNPALLVRHAVTAVATALIVFSVSLLAVMNRNVVLRAGNQVGAARVLHVQTVLTGKLIDAVHAADPSGRYAMAAAELHGGDGVAHVVAVDATRLAAVSPWRAAWAGLDPAQVRSRLAPAHRASVIVRGSRMVLGIANVVLRGSDSNPDPHAAPPKPEVTAVFLVDDRWVTAPLGKLSTDTHTLGGPIPCRRGCVLRQLQFNNPISTLFSATFEVRSISTDSQPASAFSSLLDSPRAWQSTLRGAEPGLPDIAQSEFGAGAGLHVRLRDQVGNSLLGLAPADGPAVLPAIIADGVPVDAVVGLPGAVDGTGFDQLELPLRVVASAAALPRAVGNGVLVDLADAQRLSDPSESHLDDQVWLAANTPPSVLTALRKHGLTVASVELESTERSLLLAQAPVRTLVANRICVLLVAVLALMALAAGVAIDLARRRRYVRVLRDGGFAPTTIGRYAVLETLLPEVVAVVLGGVAAVVSLLVAGRRLPLFGDSVGPPIDAAPSGRAVGLVVLIAFGVVGVASLLVGMIDARASRRLS